MTIFSDEFLLQRLEYFGQSQNSQLCLVFQWKSSFTCQHYMKQEKCFLKVSASVLPKGPAACLVWTRTLTEMHIVAFPDKKKTSSGKSKLSPQLPVCLEQLLVLLLQAYKNGLYYPELLQLETNLKPSSPRTSSSCEAGCWRPSSPYWPPAPGGRGSS